MLAVRVLGPFEVARNDLPVVVPGVRTRAVVARLALSAGTVVGVDTLLDDVWGDALPANPLNALQARISQIRNVLGVDAVRATRPGYVLDTLPDGVDALLADSLVVQARRQFGGDDAAAAALLDRALGLWRGPALADLGDAPFVHGAVARFDELHLDALESRLRLDVDGGRAAVSLAPLEALAGRHPLRESVHELLVRAYASVGRQVDALAAYRRIRDRLVTDLGIDPGPRLQALEIAVLQQDRDLIEPAYRARPAGPDQLDPARDGVAIGNVPRPLSPLLHRSGELDAIETLLAERRLVTITGPAGVGKTRLAIELASRAAARRRDGVWFVGLDGTDRAERVADAIATVLASPLDEPLTGLCTRLRRADVLIVVDNCEHLGDGPAVVVRELLQRCPGLSILATSQRALGVAGEVVWPLEPMANPDAVELFFSKLLELNARTTIDDATRRAAAVVCTVLDGLPLAIELAARRCGVLTVDELARRLGDRLETLSDRRTDRVERHRTLAAAIGWSYELLFPDAQQMLQVLAAFPDGAEISAIEDAAGAAGLPGDEIVDLVGQLVDRSLVVAEQRDGRSRYRLLNSIRAFALERASVDGRIDAVHGAHAHAATRFARACFRGLRTGDQARWIAALRRERSNLDAAFEWLVVHDADAALALANNLFLGWLIVGDGLAGAARLARAGAMAVDAPPVRRAVSRACQAVLLARSGRADDAVPIVTEALATVEANASSLVVAHTRSMAGQVYTYAQRVEEGIALMRAAKAELAANGDQWAEAICTLNLALAAGRVGDDVEQERLTQESLVLLGTRSDPFTDHLAHRNLGLVQFRRGAHRDASASLQRALAAERNIGFAAEEALTLRALARVHLAEDDGASAVAALTASIAISRRVGDAAAADEAQAELDATRAAGPASSS